MQNTAFSGEIYFQRTAIYAAFSAVICSTPVAMLQAFAELRYGVVAHTLENSVKYGHNLGHTPRTDYGTALPFIGG